MWEKRYSRAVVMVPIHLDIPSLRTAFHRLRPVSSSSVVALLRQDTEVGDRVDREDLLRVCRGVLLPGTEVGQDLEDRVDREDLLVSRGVLLPGTEVGRDRVGREGLLRVSRVVRRSRAVDRVVILRRRAILRDTTPPDPGTHHRIRTLGDRPACSSRAVEVVARLCRAIGRADRGEDNRRRSSSSNHRRGWGNDPDRVNRRPDNNILRGRGRGNRRSKEGGKQVRRITPVGISD